MKEWQTIPIRDELHRVLKKQAIDQGKKLRDFTNEILAEAMEKRALYEKPKGD